MEITFKMILFIIGIYLIPVLLGLFPTLKHRELKRFLLLIFASAYVALSLATLDYLYDSIKKSTGEKLLSYAPGYATIFSQMGHEELNQYTSSGDPLYLKLIDLQLKWLKENTFITDTYSMKKNDQGKTVFIVDSETDYNKNGMFDPEDDREIRTRIGEIYDRSIPELDGAFNGVPGFTYTPYKDRWGTWVSAWVPIYNHAGKVDGVLGVDFAADVYLGEIDYVQSLWLFGFSAFYLLIVGLLRLRQKSRKYGH